MNDDFASAKGDQLLENIENVTAAVYKHRSAVDNAQAQQDLENAQSVWENVCSLPTDANSCSPRSTSIITVDETINYFKNCDLDSCMTNIVPVVERTKISLLFRLLWGPPALDSSLDDERKLVFAIASCPFRNEEIVHLRVLQTVYKQLTNTQRDCPRFGPHWERIGFQGNDPSTDLRGVGFLGLVNLLHFVMNPQTLPLARDILQLSHDEKQNFPFAVMGINLTRIVLQTLREERLNKECNRRKNVINVINDFYVAIFLHLYNIWCKNKVTIESSGWVLKDVEVTVKKKPRLILRNLEDYINENKAEIESNTAAQDLDVPQSLPSIFSELESDIQYADEEIS